MLSEIDIQMNELSISAEAPMLGRTIGDIETRGKGAFIVAALKRDDGSTLIHPDSQAILREGDKVMIMGNQGDMPNFAQRSAPKSQLRYRG